MAVLRPLKVVMTNYPEGQVEEVDVINNPEDASAGTRKVPFSRVLYIERDDFMEDPPKKFFRLSPGKEVRLRCAYFITCTEVVKDEHGEVVELRCTYDPGDARRRFAGRPPREGDAALGVGGARDAGRGPPVRPSLLGRGSRRTCREGKTFLDYLNPALARGAARLPRPSRAWPAPSPGTRVQFERLGYFCVDPDSTADALVFNRTVSLRDTWARISIRRGEADGFTRAARRSCRWPRRPSRSRRFAVRARWPDRPPRAAAVGTKATRTPTR